MYIYKHLISLYLLLYDQTDISSDAHYYVTNNYNTITTTVLQYSAVLFSYYCCMYSTQGNAYCTVHTTRIYIVFTSVHPQSMSNYATVFIKQDL